MAKQTESELGFAAGVGYAIALCQKYYNEGAARLIYIESGMSFTDFKCACDPDDLKAIRACMKYNGIKK